MTPRFIASGAFILDEIIYHDRGETTYSPGGSVLYSALGAALTGIDVGLVSVVGRDYPQSLLSALTAKGIDLGGVQRLDSLGCRCTIEYRGQDRKIAISREGLSLSDAMPQLEHVPVAWRTPALGIHVGPGPFEAQTRFLVDIRRSLSATLSVDPSYEIPTDIRAPYLAALQEADFLMPSEAEFRLLQGRECGATVDDLHLQMQALGQGNLRGLVLKRAERGVCALDRRTGQVLEEPALQNLDIVDFTGAGDAFCGAFAAAHVVSQDVRAALRSGMIAASFALEGEGCTEILGATPGDFRQRYIAVYPDAGPIARLS